MKDQETRFDTVETLNLMGQATQFWQSINAQMLEEICDAEMDNAGAPSTHQAA